MSAEKVAAALAAASGDARAALAAALERAERAEAEVARLCVALDVIRGTARMQEPQQWARPAQFRKLAEEALAGGVLCVCGHARGEHWSSGSGECVHDCDCLMFRAALTPPEASHG